MTNLKNLEGLYNSVGNYLIHTSQNLKLLITSRTNLTAKKSVNFLLDKTDKSGSYISSLYSNSTHTNIDSYTFDYKEFKYVLEIDKTENKGEIKQC